MTQPTPALSSIAARELLLGLADRIDQRRTNAAMTEALCLAQALVVAERLYGPTEAAEAAEQELLTLLPPIRQGTARGEYAALLRLLAQGVTA
jgi:hypothetical protein